MLPSFEIHLNPHKKIYFASDFHLGASNLKASQEREKKIVNWLNSISNDAQVIFLVGDLFDFWHEYKRVVPRGFTRFFGKLAELTDSGVKIIVFTGNHDLWMLDYFETELGIQVVRGSVELVVSCESLSDESLSDKSRVLRTDLTTHDSKLKTNFYLTHGDGLGPGDNGYKLLKKWLFDNRFVKWAFRTLLHPDFALMLGQAWAGYSWRKHEKEEPPTFWGEDKEWLYLFAKEMETKQHHDYYIFGHRHIVLNHQVAKNSKIIILGDWITHFTFGVFDGQNFELNHYQE